MIYNKIPITAPTIEKRWSNLATSLLFLSLELTKLAMSRNCNKRVVIYKVRSTIEGIYLPGEKVRKRL